MAAVIEGVEINLEDFQPNAKFNKSAFRDRNDYSKVDIHTIDFDSIYRTGNFGISLGKINQPRAKRWIVFYLVVSALFIALSVSGVFYIDHYKKETLVPVIKVYTLMGSSLCILAACLGTYFIWRYPSTERPYRMLMIFRVLCILAFIICVMFGWLFPLVVALASEDKFEGLNTVQVLGIRIVYGIVALIMVVESVVSYAFLFHWWSGCMWRGKTYSDRCKCCAGCCVYDQGEELAPGIRDPPSTAKWLKFAKTMNTVGKVSNAVS